MSTTETPVTGTTKTCGDCGMCCKIMGVEALSKPAGRWCGHFRRASGCAVYEDRPDDCRAFNCLWLLTDALGPEWKPSQAGFVLHSENSGERLIVECDATRPHDWRRAPYEEQIRRWADAGLEVLVLVGARGIRLGAGSDSPLRRGTRP